MWPEGRSRGCVKGHIFGIQDVDACQFGCGGDADAAWLGMRATRDVDVDLLWMWMRAGGGCGCGHGGDVDACWGGMRTRTQRGCGRVLAGDVDADTAGMWAHCHDEGFSGESLGAELPWLNSRRFCFVHAREWTIGGRAGVDKGGGRDAESLQCGPLHRQKYKPFDTKVASNLC